MEKPQIKGCCVTVSPGTADTTVIGIDEHGTAFTASVHATSLLKWLNAEVANWRALGKETAAEPIRKVG